MQAGKGMKGKMALPSEHAACMQHAGLTTDERTLLEAAYRKGVLRCWACTSGAACQQHVFLLVSNKGCLCATSTLAAGVRDSEIHVKAWCNLGVGQPQKIRRRSRNRHQSFPSWTQLSEAVIAALTAVHCCASTFQQMYCSHGSFLNPDLDFQHAL